MNQFWVACFLIELVEGGDLNVDPQIQRGTIIELPMLEGESAETWDGLSNEQKKMLFEASKVNVFLEPEGLEQ